VTTDPPAGLAFRLVRMYCGPGGHTAFADLGLPGPAVAAEESTPSLVLGPVPATTVNVIELLERRPKLDLHPPPRRQWVIILRGAMQISTTAGQRRRFGPGDCLLAEDMQGKGHWTEDVGEERLVTLNIGVPDDWRWPGN
jgi:mannose-6-phosphate isomerase-like protein (cupin superfamily)